LRGGLRGDGTQNASALVGQVAGRQMYASCQRRETLVSRLT